MTFYIDGSSLNGKTYEKFMEFLFSKSDTFTYTKIETQNPVDDNDKKYASKIKQFESLTNFLLKGKFNSNCYGCSMGTEKQIFVLKLNNEFLKSYIKNKKDISKWNYPDCVEDICFFNSNECIFESSSHEEIYAYYADNEKDEEELTKIGVKFI
ncbi:MAG: hypothetical protein IJN78_06720 [Clostridia bacterium]|nr:hypothetical protein [Clostridia bacterium]